MQVDHVEILVPDRASAADWYSRVLGFERVEKLAEWAASGPLMMANASGQMIALFTGPAQGQQPPRGWIRLAFRASAEEFRRFVRDSANWRDVPLGLSDIQDHSLAISVYFTDPFGNPLEVTTYEHQAARQFVQTLTQP